MESVVFENCIVVVVHGHYLYSSFDSLNRLLHFTEKVKLWQPDSVLTIQKWFPIVSSLNVLEPVGLLDAGRLSRDNTKQKVVVDLVAWQPILHPCRLSCTRLERQRWGLYNRSLPLVELERVGKALSTISRAEGHRREEVLSLSSLMPLQDILGKVCGANCTEHCRNGESNPGTKRHCWTAMPYIVEF